MRESAGTSAGEASPVASVASCTEGAASGEAVSTAQWSPTVGWRLSAGQCAAAYAGSGRPTRGGESTSSSTGSFPERGAVPSGPAGLDVCR